MAKKSKEKSKSIQENPPNSNSNNNIFNKLFGGDLIEEESNSLFSSDNPFRRKQVNEIPPISENPKISDGVETSRKRNKDEIGLDGDKKLKKEKKLGQENPNFEKKLDYENPNFEKLGEENPNLEKLKKGKKLKENPNLENLGEENPNLEKLKKGKKLKENPNLKNLGEENPNLEKLKRGKKLGENPNFDNLGEENPSFEKSKKGKKLVEENPNFDNLGEENPNFEKLKKGKKLGENPNLENLGENPNLENPNLGDKNPNLEKLGEKIANLGIGKEKKKRKRDEIEREYEIKKYGSVVEEEFEGEKKREKGKKRKEMENVEEMVVTEEGYDDESKLLRTVFVGNLPLKVKKKVLIKEFCKFGEIDSVRIRNVPTLDSKKPKKIQVISGKLNEAVDSVNAYIVFKTEKGAEASLAHNMSVVGGNHIRVDRACPPRKKLKGDDASATLYNNKRTLFVGNLPFDVKDEELYRLFCGIKQLETSVEAVRVIRDRGTSLGKGIAFVMFKTREAANIACRKHNLKLRDRELRICHVKTSTTQSTTPSKRKGPFEGNSETSPAKKTPTSGKTPESRYKVNARGDTSYQGLRASKSGEKMKTPQRRSMTPASVTSGMKRKSGDKVKQRSEKRPAVAARKAKAKILQSGGVPNQTGKKRKMDSRTPQSSNKKSKKLK